jgi:hypothetical protein
LPSLRGAGRRETAGPAEDTPTKSRDGRCPSRANWMCRPGWVVDHCMVVQPLGTTHAKARKSSASGLSAGRDRFLLRKSVNSTNEAETLRWEMSQAEPERVFAKDRVSQVEAIRQGKQRMLRLRKYPSGDPQRSPTVCVRFLRTQQCDKSQCLLVLDRMAGQARCGFVWLFGFGFLWQDDFLPG